MRGAQIPSSVWSPRLHSFLLLYNLGGAITNTRPISGTISSALASSTVFVSYLAIYTRISGEHSGWLQWLNHDCAGTVPGFQGPLKQFMQHGDRQGLLPSNGLTGSIPDISPRSTPQLQAFALKYQNISGTLPPEIFRLPYVNLFEFPKNHISGAGWPYQSCELTG